MSEQSEDRVLTYWGFTHSKLGNLTTALAYYEKALVRNPDNILAQSYMGQALVEAGFTKDARAQLDEIRTRGGAGGWAARSLASAIETGRSYAY